MGHPQDWSVSQDLRLARTFSHYPVFYVSVVQFLYSSLIFWHHVFCSHFPFSWSPFYSVFYIYHVPLVPCPTPLIPPCLSFYLSLKYLHPDHHSSDLEPRQSGTQTLKVTPPPASIHACFPLLLSQAGS